MEPTVLGFDTNIWYCATMASKNTSIALGKPFTDFARRKVESGEFGSTSEVVREAMRQYIAEDTRIEALRAMIQKGLDSGIDENFDIDVWFEEEFGNQSEARH
jgi:antitoxin ParD1/3/4